MGLVPDSRPIEVTPALKTRIKRLHKEDLRDIIVGWLDNPTILGLCRRYAANDNSEEDARVQRYGAADIPKVSPNDLKADYTGYTGNRDRLIEQILLDWVSLLKRQLSSNLKPI
jgi:hypothetical protein